MSKVIQKNKHCDNNRFQPVKITENYTEFNKYWNSVFKKQNHKERLKKYIEDYFFPIFFLNSFFTLLLFLVVIIISNTNHSIMIQSILLFFPICGITIACFGYIITYQYLDQPMRFILDVESKIMLISDESNHRRLVAYSLKNIEFITFRIREMGNPQARYFPTIPNRGEWIENPFSCCLIELQLVYKKKKRSRIYSTTLSEMLPELWYKSELPDDYRNKTILKAKTLLKEQIQKYKQELELGKENWSSYSEPVAYELFSTNVRMKGDEWEATENTIARVLAKANNLEYKPFIVEIPLKAHYSLEGQYETPPPAPATRWLAELYPEKVAIAKPFIYDNDLNIVQVDLEKNTKNKN